ncbi:MAG TPA: hypothetical protein VFH26_01235 [Gemmatimonadales bacterium]|nr:hypothetical protein [Gemmatimonadales bacterium]
MKLVVTYLVVAALAASLVTSTMQAQWSVGAEVGADRFWGGSIEKADDERSFRPYRPTTFGARIKREAPGLGVGVRLGYFSAGMALEGPDGLALANGVFTVYSMAPELLYRIAVIGSANRLLLGAGPLLETWKALDEESETRLGVHGAVALHVPLGWKVEAVLSAGGALIPSPFAEDQLEFSFERRPLWRRRFSLGLEYRL